MAAEEAVSRSYAAATLLVIATIAIVAVIAGGAIIGPRPTPDPRVQTLVDSMGHETPAPCISFTTRGFVPCPS